MLKLITIHTFFYFLLFIVIGCFFYGLCVQRKTIKTLKKTIAITEQMITDDHIATIKWCERDYNLKINDIMNQYSDYVEKTIVRLEENNKTIDQISSQIDEIIKLNKCLKCRGNIAR